MAYTKAAMKATDKYVKANYARLNIKIPKHQREAVEAFAAERGESINSMVNRLIRCAMGIDQDAWKTHKQND